MSKPTQAHSERAHTDNALVDERRKTDDEIEKHTGPESHAGVIDSTHEWRALSAVIGSEREQTDARLRFERSRADAIIASRDAFLGIVSHDLRNMLSTVMMSAAALERVEAGAPAQARIDREAQRIQRATTRMTRLVGDLLDVVSMEAGRLTITPQSHDLRDLVRETHDSFELVAAAKKISLVGEAGDRPLLARCDRDRILQVLTNLVGNAIKFTPEGGRIEVVAERTDGHIRVSVKDSGIGIKPDDASRIFDRFWKVSTPDGRGVGLGLFISKSIVEAHSGQIGVESERGVGTLFWFSVPVAASAQ